MSMFPSRRAPNPQGLEGVTALVTGAGAGIGRAIAIRLAADGAKVAAADRDAHAVKETAAQISRTKGEAIALTLDVSEPAQWHDAIAASQRQLGPLTALVNNAGVMLASTIPDTSLEDFRRIIAVNLRGVFLGMKSALEAMSAADGAIVNISSTAGLRGVALASAYAASKAGVLSLTRSAAVQLAREGRGVRVNAVCPGPIETPVYRAVPGAVFHQIGETQYRELVTASVPMGRFGAPEDIAGAVRFLLSSDAKFVTGAVLAVDGGQSA